MYEVAKASELINAINELLHFIPVFSRSLEIAPSSSSTWVVCRLSESRYFSLPLSSRGLEGIFPKFFGSACSRMLHIINHRIISLIRCSILIESITKNLLSYLCLALRMMNGITRYGMAFINLGYKSLNNMHTLCRDLFHFHGRNHSPIRALQN